MKRQIIYLVLVAVAAVLVFAFENPFASRLASKKYSNFFQNLDAEKIARIEITQIIDGTALSKQNGKWFAEELITEHKKELYAKEGNEIPAPERVPADEEKIKSAIGVISNLERGTLMARSADKHDALQVGETGVLISGFNDKGENLFKLIVGKSGPDLISTYVRDPGSDEVFLIESPLVGAFSTRASDWTLPKPASEPQAKETAPVSE